MTATYADILETTIFQAMVTFISAVTDLDQYHIIRLPVNRTAMPKGDFIALSPVGSQQLATNSHDYSDPTGTTEKITRPTQYTMQVDSYGASSKDRANTLVTLLRDQYGVDALAATNAAIAPLYADDAHQLPLVDGEQQYEERWTFNAVLEIDPTITLTVETANTLTVGVTSVERTYPA